jgi:hypothetical protein
MGRSLVTDWAVSVPACRCEEGAQKEVLAPTNDSRDGSSCFLDSVSLEGLIFGGMVSVVAARMGP